MLTATHLKLIVGPEEYTKNQSILFDLIDSSMDLSSLCHILWTTNRQNGKTTTLAQFIAALAVMSPMGGALAYVYSTTRDKAADLVKAVKRYVKYLTDTPHVRAALASYGLIVSEVEGDNVSAFTIRSFVDPLQLNEVKARYVSV
jgi:uncharacterized protein YxeA